MDSSAKTERRMTITLAAHSQLFLFMRRTWIDTKWSHYKTPTPGLQLFSYYQEHFLFRGSRKPTKWLWHNGTSSMRKASLPQTINLRGVLNILCSNRHCPSVEKTWLRTWHFHYHEQVPYASTLTSTLRKNKSGRLCLVGNTICQNRIGLYGRWLTSLNFCDNEQNHRGQKYFGYHSNFYRGDGCSNMVLYDIEQRW